MTAPPIPFVWDGEAMRPWRGYGRMADQHYVIGANYTLVEFEDRSVASHNHTFAWLKDAWENLPEEIAPHHPSPEHLRKWALIAAGFYDEERIDAGSSAAAERVAGSIRWFPGEAFSAVVVRGPLVVIRRPKSMSRRCMDKTTFTAAKDGVLRVVSELIGVEPDELERNAGRAA